MKLYIFGVFICLIFSCNKGDKRIELKNLNVPEELIVYNKKDSLDLIRANSEPFKIYTSIDVSCATCILELSEWREFVKHLKNSKVSLIPICHSQDNFEMLKYLFENGEIEPTGLLLILDEKNEFINLNKNLLDEKKRITVLVNSQNKILLEGNPLEDKNLMNKYTTLINNRN